MDGSSGFSCCSSGSAATPTSLIRISFTRAKRSGKKFLDGMEVGKAGCEAEVENNTTHYVEESAQKAKWAREW